MTSRLEAAETAVVDRGQHAWTVSEDEAFFRLVSPLFSAAFAYGGGVLLASYDPEP